MSIDPETTYDADFIATITGYAKEAESIFIAE